MTIEYRGQEKVFFKRRGIGIYPGQYYDAETGLHYNLHRYQDPKTGRYITPDPIGQAGGINLYSYVRNNPVNLTDAKGLFVDGILDAGFILWDLWDIIAADNPCERNESITALGLDVAGFFAPVITGLGRGYKGMKTLERGSAKISKTSVITDPATAQTMVNKFKGDANTRMILDRKTGEVVGEITEDAGKIIRYPHIDNGTPQKHWNLENKETGFNVHLIEVP